MPSLSEVLAFRERMYEYSRSLVEKKGRDYNYDQQQEGDTLYNLKVCEILGVVNTVEQGILTRLSDKFMRLISLSRTPGREPSVDESIYDTVADIHNYIDFLILIREERSKRVTSDTNEPVVPEHDNITTWAWPPPATSYKSGTCPVCKCEYVKSVEEE